MASIKKLLTTVAGSVLGISALRQQIAERKRAQAVRDYQHRTEAKASESPVVFPESGRKGGVGTTAPPPASPTDSTEKEQRFAVASSRPTAAEKTGKPISAPGAQEMHHDVRQIHGAFGYLKELYQRFNGDHCPAWGAALSFFSILSFVPVLICGIALLGLLIQDPQTAARQVERFLVNLIPGAGASSTAREIIKEANIEQHAAELMRISGWASLIGILSLFWAASRIFVNAATPMNAAFRTEETRGFVQMQLYAIGLLFGAGGLFLLSFLPTSGPDFMRNIPYFASLPDPSPIWLDWIFVLLGVAINALMFTVIYRFLPSPSAGIEWKEAAFAGGIIAVLWETAKQGFALYLRHFGGEQGYDKVYGSLGGMIILILWVYYSSLILLLGAEIAKLYSDVRDAQSKRATA